MDVLALVKGDHLDLAERLATLKRRDPTKNKKFLRTMCEAMQSFVGRNRDYFYPEIDGLFDGSEALVELAHSRATGVDRLVDGLMKSASRANTTRKTLEKRLGELEEALGQLVRFEQETLMPKVRRSMRTEEREDLGQVFLDLRDDAGEPGQAARKRA